MPVAILFGTALAFLLTLAALAAYADRHRETLARWLDHPIVYSLALSVYFTAWAYFGTGAAFLDAGVAYLGHDMGWSFTFLLGWPLLVKAIRFMQAHRVTTLPGALAVRFGSSPILTGLVAGALVVALLSYIALQLQGIAFAFGTLAPGPAGQGFEATVLTWTAIVTLFAILFGARRPDPTLRHPGVVAAMAVSGVVKLVAVGLVAAAALGRFPNRFGAAGGPASA